MSIFYRIAALLLVIFALFAKTTFDGHEITYNDKLCLILGSLLFSVLAKLEELKVALQEKEQKNI